MFGFLNIYKPKGITSFDVIARLRKISNIRQIGHAGTLDPFAQGVLPVCIGKATKLIEYMSDDKQYLATVQFGANTETYDTEGAITQTFDKKITQDEIIKELKNFEGEIMQLPPIYSAIKVNGKKLYEYARKGQSVEISPRKITIYNIALQDFDKSTQQAKILVSCSKGTYIRSLAYDLGKNLNCGGYLKDLIRTKAGKFNIENSVKLEELTDVKELEKYILNPVDFLDIPKINLDNNEKEKTIHGMSFKNNLIKDSKVVFLIYSDKIYGIGMVDNYTVKVKKVFEEL